MRALTLGGERTVRCATVAHPRLVDDGEAACAMFDRKDDACIKVAFEP